MVRTYLRREGLFGADLEVKVHDLVREAGKLVAEAEVVGALFRGVEIKGVILFSLSLVEYAVIWAVHGNVHIEIASRYYLEKINGIGFGKQ